MEIVIIDDEKHDINTVKHAVSSMNKKIKLNNFVCPQEFMSTHKPKSDNTIYFVDLVFENSKINGLELASKIEKSEKSSLIVYFTSHPSMVYGQTTHVVRSFNIIDKTSKNIDLQIQKTIELAGERFDNQHLVIKSKFENHYIPLKEILFIESVKTKGRCVVHCQSGIHEFNMLLKNCYTQLDDRFIYMRRTHIVNRKRIVKLDFKKLEIIFNNGYTCPFSRTYAKKNDFEK